MRISNQLREFLSFALVLILALGSPFVPLAEARTKKGEKLLKDGQLAEARKEFDKALTLFEQALESDPRDTGYQLAVRRARFQASQWHVDKGQDLRKAGKLDEAMAEFQRAFALDAASTIAEQELRRTFDMIQREKKQKEQGQQPKEEERGLTPAAAARKDMEDRVAGIQGVPELKPMGKIQNLRINNQPVKNLWDTVAKLAGITVIFDQDYLQQSTRNFSLEIQTAGLEEALDQVAVLTKAFWKPISANSIFVTQDQVTKRRDYEEQVVKTFYLQNVTSPQELQEVATVIRSVTDIRRLLTYNGQMAMTLRGSVDQVNLAQKIILDLDKPRAEVVIDVMVMEANRTKTRDLASAIAYGGTAGIRTAINFTPRNPVLSGTTGGGGTTTGGTSTVGGVVGGVGTGTGTSTPTSNLLSLARVGRISSNDFSVTMPNALLNAILQDRETRVLQNPQVRTLDTTKVTLKIGDKYPYATGSFQPGIGAVGVSPLVSTQFQFADVGVNVDLTPKVHGADEVSMHIEIEISNIRDNIDVGGLRQPVIGTRRISEDVRLREGEVTLLGGLTTLNNSRVVNGIPGLANLPGIGRLFGSESKDESRSELLVALMPRIVRSPEISDVNMRGVAAGNDQTVKLSYAPREPKTPEIAGAPITAIPMTVVPTPAPVATPAQQPPVVPPGEAKPPAPTPPAAAGQAQITVTAPTAPVMLAGIVTVTVQATNVQDLAAAPMRINYDTQILKLIEVRRGAMMAADGQAVDFSRDLAASTVKLNRLAGAPGVTGSGPLVTLIFQALGKGTSQVTVEDLRLENSKREPIPAAIAPATIRVQ